MQTMSSISAIALEVRLLGALAECLRRVFPCDCTEEREALRKLYTDQLGDIRGPLPRRVPR